MITDGTTLSHQHYHEFTRKTLRSATEATTQHDAWEHPVHEGHDRAEKVCSGMDVHFYESASFLSHHAARVLRANRRHKP